MLAQIYKSAVTRIWDFLFPSLFFPPLTITNCTSPKWTAFFPFFPWLNQHGRHFIVSHVGACGACVKCLWSHNCPSMNSVKREQQLTALPSTVQPDCTEHRLLTMNVGENEITNQYRIFVCITRPCILPAPSLSVDE